MSTVIEDQPLAGVALQELGQYNRFVLEFLGDNPTAIACGLTRSEGRRFYTAMEAQIEKVEQQEGSSGLFFYFVPGTTFLMKAGGGKTTYSTGAPFVLSPENYFECGRSEQSISFMARGPKGELISELKLARAV